MIASCLRGLWRLHLFGTLFLLFSFFLLLQLFSNFSLPVYTIALIPIAYVMQSVAPVPAISDIGVRVFVTTLLFGGLL